MLKRVGLAVGILGCVAVSPLLSAQETDENAAAQANNPLANMTAFNIQTYFIPEFTGVKQAGNQGFLRYAKPVSIGGDWLVRASLPVPTLPTGENGASSTGVGDFNVFAAYLIDVGDPAISFGIGPQLTVPTATADNLGTEKWSAGLANVLFNARSKTFQWGYLLTWQHSFAGNNERSSVNVGAFQPFAMYQLGKGLYLRSTGIMVYDFESDDYTVPIGVGIGKVIPQGSTVFNVFMEPQVSVFDRGELWPSWQVFVGFNIQFMGS